MCVNLLFLCEVKSSAYSHKYPQARVMEHPEYTGNENLDTCMNLFRNKYDSHSYRSTVRIVSDILLRAKKNCRGIHDIILPVPACGFEKISIVDIFYPGEKPQKFHVVTHFNAQNS